MFTSLEVCAGAGGMALGLERAGFHPVMLVDNDPHPCRTLSRNRPRWNVLQTDLRDFVGAEHPSVLDVDLLSAGIPGTAYSSAGKNQGPSDPRDLLSTVTWLTIEVRPRALLIECTDSLLKDPRFSSQRDFTREELTHQGYEVSWKILAANDFGVPQTRTHSILVAMRTAEFKNFRWPQPDSSSPTVGDTLRESMRSRGWQGADTWAEGAQRPAPKLVGGAKSHGGADLGPTGSKKAWASMGINGWSLADELPDVGFVLEYGVGKHGREGLPRLTTEQIALLQGFDDSWVFTGGKTARYRQIAQCTPPPLAEAVGQRIASALAATSQSPSTS